MSATPVPRLRAVDLNLLTLLDAMLAERNVTRAAERLGMTQPAVSNALARLRLLFDDELFVRRGKEMAPTPRALSLASPIRKALELIQASLARPDAFDAAVSHTFRLALGDLGEAILLPRFLRWIEELGAAVRLDVRREPGASLCEEMRLGEVDLALDQVAIAADDFRRKRLFDLELVPLVRRDHPSVGASLSLDAYLGLEHVILEPRPGQTNLADQALAVVGRSRRVRAQVPSYLIMPLLVAQSDLVCTVPAPLARLFEQRFPVRAVSCPIPVPKIPVFMMWHAAHDEDPAHVWLRRSLLELAVAL